MSRFSVDTADRLSITLTVLVGASLVVAGSWKALSWIGHGHLPGKDLNSGPRVADDAIGQSHGAGEQSKCAVNVENRHSSEHHEHQHRHHSHHHHHHHHHKHAQSLSSNNHEKQTPHGQEAGQLFQSRSRTEPYFPSPNQTYDHAEGVKSSSQILPFQDTHDEPSQMSHSDGHFEETDAKQKKHKSSGLSGSSPSLDPSNGASVSADELSRILQRNINDYFEKHAPELEPEKSPTLPETVPGLEPPGRRLRSLAQEEARLRKLAFEASKRAYKSNQKAEAKRLSDQGKLHDENARRYNALAAEEVFNSNNSRRQSSRCDLHGLHVDEALQYARNHLVACRASGTDKTMLIVGRGSHSHQGSARIKPAIMAMLSETGGIVADVHEKNEGCIVVEFAVRR
ncbi:hypothetical protein A7U60_g993 [Sanghuangporus baumii]|uniref:Smr domain-containing protein n=1 Tax=Sanghuangporus baumii TaxID=108892 RepID=A0A9Q5I4Q1_SANBA|nr:hypothetical protein A7U60_g993 [Sanghuangporus baumii]